MSLAVSVTTNALMRIKCMFAPIARAPCLEILVACDQLATVVGEGVASDSRPASSFRATMVGVGHGDTVTVLDATDQQHAIRLAGIDAPEGGQPWGDRSRQARSALTFGRMVSVQPTDTDRYGRVVARVLGGGQDVNRPALGR